MFSPHVFAQGSQHAEPARLIESKANLTQDRSGLVAVTWVDRIKVTVSHAVGKAAKHSKQAQPFHSHAWAFKRDLVGDLEIQKPVIRPGSLEYINALLLPASPKSIQIGFALRGITKERDRQRNTIQSAKELLEVRIGSELLTSDGQKRLACLKERQLPRLDCLAPFHGARTRGAAQRSDQSKAGNRCELSQKLFDRQRIGFPRRFRIVHRERNRR